MIAGVIGYDSIRKHLAECGYHTVEIREKCHPYGCVHRKLEDMPDEPEELNNMKELQNRRCGYWLCGIIHCHLAFPAPPGNRS
mgnify:CR=1 FL=1